MTQNVPKLFFFSQLLKNLVMVYCLCTKEVIVYIITIITIFYVYYYRSDILYYYNLWQIPYLGKLFSLRYRNTPI